MVPISERVINTIITGKSFFTAFLLFSLYGYRGWFRMKITLNAEPGKNSQQPGMIEGYENMAFDLTNIYQSLEVLQKNHMYYNE
jgi:hypothetical protein